MFKHIKNKWNFLNCKALGGAMDVVVVQQPDGTLLSTPFYLRIGQSYMLTALNLSIFLVVNGKIIDGVKMNATSSGLCHFEVDANDEANCETSTQRNSNFSNLLRTDMELGYVSTEFNDSNKRSLMCLLSPTKSIRMMMDKSPNNHSRWDVEEKEFERFRTRSFSETDLYMVYPDCTDYENDNEKRWDAFSLKPPSSSHNKDLHKQSSQSLVKESLTSPPIDKILTGFVSRGRGSSARGKWLCTSGAKTASDGECSSANMLSHCSSSATKKSEYSSIHSDMIIRSFSVNDLMSLQESYTTEYSQSSVGSKERFNLDEYVREPRVSDGIINGPRDVNRKIHDNMVIELIEISDIKFNDLCKDRLVDVTKSKWTTIVSKNVPMLYDPANASKLVRLTLTNGKQQYFTAAYLNKKPINFDFHSSTHFLSYSRVSYSKYMNLPSSILQSFNLRSGINQMQYLIRSSKGAGFITASIFKWNHDDRLVISDIDGTVTKSDVLGHIYGFIGMDYSHEGVAKLFTTIVNNGYKLLYCSSRPLVQMHMTRNYMYRVRQDGNYSIPRGPILLNSSSIFTAIRNELFDRGKVEEFKVNALERVRQLFPNNYQPFHAAFGNAETDFNAYRYCGIPKRRIFLIDKFGRIVIGRPSALSRGGAAGTQVTRLSQSNDSEEILTYTNLAELGSVVFPNATKDLHRFEDYEDMLNWYTSLSPLVEFR